MTSEGRGAGYTLSIMNRVKVALLWMLALLVAAGCGAIQLPGGASATEDRALQGAELETSVAQTVVAEITLLAENQPTATQAPPTETPLPSHTPEPSASPTITLTPTLETPMIEVSTATNCRRGPSTAYEIIGVLEEDESAEVVGRAADQDYLVIDNPDRDGSCWLWTGVAEVSGPLSGLPLLDTPPTPTPSVTPTPTVVWADTWEIWVGPAPLTHYSMTLSHSGTSINGSFNAGGGNTVTLSGTLSADYTYASGTWTSTAGGSGTFEWQRKKNIHQFIGNLDSGSADWCGARAGASQPSPCFGP